MREKRKRRVGSGHATWPTAQAACSRSRVPHGCTQRGKQQRLQQAKRLLTTCACAVHWGGGQTVSHDSAWCPRTNQAPAQLRTPLSPHVDTHYACEPPQRVAAPQSVLPLGFIERARGWAATPTRLRWAHGAGRLPSHHRHYIRKTRILGR